MKSRDDTQVLIFDTIQLHAREIVVFFLVFEIIKLQIRTLTSHSKALKLSLKAQSAVTAKSL